MVGHTTYDLTDFWERRVGELFLRGFEVWGQAPVFGVGLKNFRTHCENADFSATGRVDQRCYTHPHHLYNEWLAETGVVGLAAFVLLVALWAKELVPRLDRRRADHALGVGAFVALAVFLWPLRPSMSFFSNWNGILFWTMLGLALAVLAPRPPAIRARPEG